MSDAIVIFLPKNKDKSLGLYRFGKPRGGKVSVPSYLASHGLPGTVLISPRFSSANHTLEPRVIWARPIALRNPQS